MSDVREYYNGNTRAFLRFGKGRTRAIHRAIHAPGVRSLEEAYHVVDERILAMLAPVVAEHAARTGLQATIADLGCGVGASIAYLSKRIDARFVGITVSEVQASIATQTLTRSSWAIFASRRRTARSRPMRGLPRRT